MKKIKTRVLALLLVAVLSCTVIPTGLLQSAALVTTDTQSKVTADDFEDFGTSKTYWSGTVSENTDADNSYLKASQKGASFSSYYSENYRPEKLSITAKADAPTGIFLSTDYDNEGTPAKYYKGLWFYTYLSDNMLGLWGYRAQKDTNRILTNAQNLAKTNDSKYIRFSKTDWVDIDMELDYSNWGTKREITVTYDVTGKIYGIMMNNVNMFATSEGYSKDTVYYEKNGKTYHIGDEFTIEDVSYTYSFEGAEYDAYLQLCIGNPEDSGTFYIDNFSAEYDASHTTVCEFIDTHRGALEGTDTSDSALSAAVNAYIALAADCKAVIEEQYPDALTKLGEYAAANSTDEKVISFKTTYETLINLDAENINPDYEDSLNTAISEYGNMTEAQKFALHSVYQHLTELREALDWYVVPREDGDLSDWADDFESGSTKNWTLTTEPNDTDRDYYVNLSVVEDPDKAGNSVLYYEQMGGFLLRPNSATWPSKGAMTVVSYRFKGSNISQSYRHKLYTYYIDEENYSYICISSAAAAYTNVVSNGSRAEEVTRLATPLEITDWMDIEVTYDHKKSTYILKISDVNDTIVAINGKLPNSSGQFAIGNMRNAGYSSYGWIDDVNIKFTQGDWDVNDTITEIEPYYTGNVWMEPGDIVTISGENLGNTVSNAQIIRIEDVGDAKIGTSINYPGVQAYDYEPEADTNTHKLSNETLLQLYNFTDEDSIPLEQTTEDSVKIKIPEDFENGVYALKLTNKAGGSDAVIIINNPNLNYTFGQDGGSTPAGGDLRVFGKAIAFNDYTRVRVAIVDPDDNITECILTPYTAEDNYSVRVMLPASLESKKYEVYIHNGFGDNNNWSKAGSIEVKADVRSSWSQEIFDVTDYGAVGDLQTNDTPAFIAALEAANQNGGGIVYVPAGMYTLIHTLAIPENVSLRGDGVEKTHLFWDVSTWDMMNARALFSANSNFELCDFNIHASRRKEIVYVNNSDIYQRENIYIHNLRVKVYGWTETLTAGSGNLGYDKKTSIEELVTMLRAELSLIGDFGGSFYIAGKPGAKNVQIYDMYCYFDEPSRVNGFKVTGDYIRMSNIQVKEGSTGWSSGLINNGIMENNDLGYDSCNGFQGSNLYFGHLTIQNQTQNNREAATTDGGALYTDLIIRLDDSFPSGCVYQVTSTTITKDVLGKMLKVVDGQGYSQVRTIVSYSLNQLVFDSPFAVEPNRNSRCYIQNNRKNVFYVENQMINTGGFGSYGSAVDTVFDGNTFEQAFGYSFNLYAQTIWQTSVINSILKDAFITHGTSSISTSAQHTRYYGTYIFAQGARYAGSMNMMLFRDNQYTEGAHIVMNVQTVGNAFCNLVIQDNLFSESNSALELSVSNANEVHNFIDGWLFMDNDYVDVSVPYNSVIVKAYEKKAKNKTGDLRIKLIGESTDVIISSAFGDANNDGEFNLKDVTYTQYYILEKITVDDLESFTQRADVTGNSSVDLRDVNLMRKAILAGGWENIELPNLPETTYVVTLMNGSNSYQTISVKENGTYSELSAVTAPAAPTGKVFDGWYTAETGGTKVTAQSTIVQNASHKLYARFIDAAPVTYTLTYISNGASVGTKTIAAGDTYGTFPSVTNEGHTLKGWYLNSAGTGSAISSTDTVLSMNYSIYAVWEKNEEEDSGGLSIDLVEDKDVLK